MIANLLRMQLLEEEVTASPDESKRMADGRPAWMRTLHTSVSAWLQMVPSVCLLAFLIIAVNMEMWIIVLCCFVIYLLLSNFEVTSTCQIYLLENC